MPDRLHPGDTIEKDYEWRGDEAVLVAQRIRRPSGEAIELPAEAGR